MKKYKILLLMLLFSGVASGYDFYVSLSGSDENPGTESKPVCSLAGVQGRIEKLMQSSGYPAEGITVWIEPGHYAYEKTLILGPAISGTEKNPIRFTVAGNAKASFDGGRAINTNSASLVRDPTQLGWLTPQARGSVYSLTIENPEFRAILSSTSAKLSMDGQMMNLARYPNVGFGHIAKILNEGAVYAQGRTQGNPPKYSMENPIGGIFTVLNKNIAPWEQEFEIRQKATVAGYLSYDWYKESYKIAAIDKGTIKLLEYSRYGIANHEKIPRRIIVSNLLCELDSPGEFYYEEDAHRLFFWPFGDWSENSKLSLWAGVSFAELKGAKNIRFENIVVEGVSQGKAVVNVQGCENIELSGCVVRNCSRPAVVIEGGKNCGIRSCDIYDVPGHVTLDGGNVKKLEPSGHYAVNCNFTQVQASDFYGKIQIKGVGQIFRNNLVHNFIGQVMTVGDNDHLIEYNELFNIGIEEGDGGTIYSGAQMWSYGNVYRHNFLHHLMCIPQAHPRGGIYPDDHDAGDTIVNNVFYKAAHRAILLNGGAGHRVESNIFLDGHIGIYQTLAFAEKAYAIIEKYESGELKRGDKMDHIWRTEKVVGEKGWNNEPWISKYPTFAKVMNQEKMRFWPIECVVKDNLFSGNVQDMQVRTAWGANDIMEMEDCELIETVGNREVSMEVFRDPGVLDFGYKDQKDAGRLADIQFEKIGLYKDEYRTELPDKKKYRSAVAKCFAGRKSYDAEAKYDTASINESIYFNTGKLLIQGN